MNKKKTKNKVLYIATIAKKRNRLDGETIKSKLLEQFLENQKEISLRTVDTDNWKKHIIKLVFLIIVWYFWCDKIIISSADRGAHIVLNFFHKINNKKPIYYFVVGGVLHTNICRNKWNVDAYKNLTKIYVEANTLLEDLNSLKINNVVLLNNFRKVEEFKNNYEKTDTIKFVFFGRVIKEKGIEEAIKMIKNLNSKDKIKCTLNIYGQVNNEYLKKISDSFDETIIYNGEIKPNNKKEYEILSQYDIFVLPTEYPGECLPGALIDAYISGLAVVVSNWKYAKEYVENKKNGIIFEYKNYKDMYLKTKGLIVNNKIMEYKEFSKRLSNKYMIENILKEFSKELVK